MRVDLEFRPELPAVHGVTTRSYAGPQDIEAWLEIRHRAFAREKIGVREDSASLGIMVGGAFNHDGTALYEAMAALFISQLLMRPMEPMQQLQTWARAALKQGHPAVARRHAMAAVKMSPLRYDAWWLAYRSLRGRAWKPGTPSVST